MLSWTWAFLISEWVIRLVMLVYVPQKRSPEGARSWLLLIFIEPFVGLILYGLIGRTYISKRRRALQAWAANLVKTEGPPLFENLVHPDVPPEFQPAVALAKNLGHFPIVGGNGFELLNDYAGAIDRLVADIDAATHHVHLLYYIFADDATGRQVADALARAVGRGVACRVLMDGVGSRRSIRTLGRRLRDAGVEVHEMLPLGFLRMLRARLDLRNHRKLAVIDGRVGYVGSQNLVNPEYKKGITYEELVARVTGPVVVQMEAVFLVDRYFETEKRLPAEERYVNPVEAGSSPAQLLPSGPGYPHENTQRLMVALVHGARQRVVITTPYFIPDVPFLQAMQTAALRGVAVHLVVSRKIDQLLVGLAQRSYYEDLLESGVRIHVYHRHFLHAKHMSIDDAIVLVGSSNIDIRSFALNAEVSMLVYDPKVAARLREVQEQYFAHSEHLTLDEWNRRPLAAQVAQNMARLVDSLL